MYSVLFTTANQTALNLNLEYPDDQCAFHRTGILCGACQQNLSQVFGTSRCRECSSMWVLLWVPAFALAGIALVVALIFLNITVSVETINGLIFYANIVRANHFFPSQQNQSIPQLVHSVDQPRPRHWNLLLQWTGCLFQDMATIYVPIVHLGPGHRNHSFKLLLHYCSKTEW